jgi:tetratricopeptide (TPR) repeat protein
MEKETMRYIKSVSVVAISLAVSMGVLWSQGNQEAANLTREGIEASKAKDWDKAIAAFKKASQLESRYTPNLAAALQQRATLYMSRQKFAEAAADFSEAIKAKPNDPDIFERRAYVEMQLKEYDKALADYSAAIKLEPKEAKYYSLRAYILQQKGDFKGALADTEKVLQLDPNNADGQQRKKYLDVKLNPGPTPVVTPAGPIANPNAVQPVVSPSPGTNQPVPAPTKAP